MITGGAKFFHTSKSLAVNGATGTATNGDAASQYCLDQNKFTYWYTQGSTDASTETLTIDFGSIQSINRIFLLDHNFKAYTVKYDLAGVWTAFTNVRGLDATLTGITETVFADNSAYYEFDAVSCQQVQITMTSTQVANQDKYLSTFIATTEIGTFAGFPTITPVIADRNSKIKKTLSGKTSVIKGDETVAFNFQFKSYPSAVTYNVDIDLVMTLHDSDDPFLVWLCGGRRGTGHFNYTLRGFRLKDVYQVAIIKSVNVSYTANVTKNSLNCEMQLEESL